MLREYQLTNFKAFAGPETIPIRPITLIYGPNSSGKSSILQSLLLLKQTLEEANRSTPLLPKGKLVDLGNYREFIHRRDVKRSFTFKIMLDPNTEKARPSWVRELLKAAAPESIGLQAVFAYDAREDEERITLSNVGVFIDKSPLPVVTYFPLLDILSEAFKRSGETVPSYVEKFGPGSLTAVINPEHDFWQTWWTVTQQQVDYELSQSQATYIYRGERWQYISGIGGEEEEVRERVKRYPFEEAMEDLKAANLLGALDCQSFLPGKVRVEPHTDSPFDIRVFYPFSSNDPEDDRKAMLDISPVGFYVCSLFRQLIENMVYLGPLRSYPKRDYTYSGNVSDYVGQRGEMLPDVLFQDHSGELLKRINDEFKRFRLGYELELPKLRYEDGGLTNMFTLRLVNKETDVNASIVDVGFGISQVLPIIVQSILPGNRTLLIEQPEIHLHPALQADLGSLFAECIKAPSGNRFIIETHSEHLVLRLQKLIRERKLTPEEVSVIYVDRGPEGSRCLPLRLDDEGDFIDEWPDGFFPERLDELK